MGQSEVKKAEEMAKAKEHESRERAIREQQQAQEAESKKIE
jgi:hypothetical protein